MKHLKEFESIENNPQIGDYVICTDKIWIGQTDELNDFLLNNIGQCIKIDINFIQGYLYVIKYDNIPIFLDYFNKSNYRNMGRDEILYFSPYKEDCETYLAANKYNL